MVVYDAFNEIVYEAPENECFRWIMDKAETLTNGTKLFRTWQMDGFTYYDVGNVYHM